MQRREFLLGTAGVLGAGYAGYAGSQALTIASQSAKAELEAQTLTLQNARFSLQPEAQTEQLVSLSPDAPPPVLYATQHQPVRFVVKNTLPDEYTAMHWHGIRLPNAMDGVPYLTQLPIGPDESYDYRFTPPDAGTYWYHPHCTTMTQMARGLTGVLIVKEAQDAGFEHEQVLNLRDFRLDADGVLQAPYTLRGAARAGTHGNLMCCNWRQAPEYDHPSGALLRLRIANTDTTRVYRLYFSNALGSIIAWDGHPIVAQKPMPSRAEPLLLAPGQRVDIAMLMPTHEGERVELLAQVAGKDRTLARLRAIGTNQHHSLSELAPLAPNPIAEPDLEKAELKEFVFGWSPDGSQQKNGLCGSLGKNFWSINRVAWPGDAVENTPALARLEQGKSYILRLRNESPNLHPIHLHGLVFKPIRSNLRTLPPNWTDTVLLLKNEVIDIALVADNPGKWAFHCHVIEHQKTGLAGFIHIV